MPDPKIFPARCARLTCVALIPPKSITHSNECAAGASGSKRPLGTQSHTLHHPTPPPLTHTRHALTRHRWAIALACGALASASCGSLARFATWRDRLFFLSWVSSFSSLLLQPLLFLGIPTSLFPFFFLRSRVAWFFCLFALPRFLLFASLFTFFRLFSLCVRSGPP